MEKDPGRSAFLPNRYIQKILAGEEFFTGQHEIIDISQASGGFAHAVYKIATASGNFFLKIRGDHFPALPDVQINPDDIAYEYAALVTFGSLLPHNFPNVISFDQQNHYVITSDATPNGVLLRDALLQGDVDQEMTCNLGHALRTVHDSVAQYTQGLRRDNDASHYDQKLLHRFGFMQNRGLEQVLNALKRDKKQLILGDPAPKNIGINDDGRLFVFFDLEDAHLGNTIFDYTYVLGHILLHTLPDTIKSLELQNGFIKGYQPDVFDEDMVRKMTLGIIRYRLAGRIPYEVPNISQKLRVCILERTEEALLSDLREVRWGSLLNGILA